MKYCLFGSRKKIALGFLLSKYVTKKDWSKLSFLLHPECSSDTGILAARHNQTAVNYAWLVVILI
ncbi:hypothetical protein AHMF7605_18370 [Adhaeribacter arboris]|uniref:Uncharacterized protein n=1 Tax=Adhaeribacter arboris TaxID=2072846 RepID=A0A2T2YIK1_9BACT|nr:hypothetical protein AHMF7605_18370 [Adhaeribacter arboris]